MDTKFLLVSWIPIYNFVRILDTIFGGYHVYPFLLLLPTSLLFGFNDTDYNKYHRYYINWYHDAIYIAIMETDVH